MTSGPTPFGCYFCLHASQSSMPRRDTGEDFSMKCGNQVYTNRVVPQKVL